MDASNGTIISIETTVNAPIAKVWEYYTKPEHIVNWSFASDDWHSPYAENDLRKDGKFKTGMAAKDGSFSFDFEGVYTNVEDHRLIAYRLGDGRESEVHFKENGETTEITGSFNAETQNPIEMQQAGWQAILDNFKKYTEGV